MKKITTTPTPPPSVETRPSATRYSRLYYVRIMMIQMVASSAILAATVAMAAGSPSCLIDTPFWQSVQGVVTAAFLGAIVIFCVMLLIQYLVPQIPGFMQLGAAINLFILLLSLVSGLITCYIGAPFLAALALVSGLFFVMVLSIILTSFIVVGGKKIIALLHKK
jgi:hypothetical protein